MLHTPDKTSETVSRPATFFPTRPATCCVKRNCYQGQWHTTRVQNGTLTKANDVLSKPMHSPSHSQTKGRLPRLQIVLSLQKDTSRSGRLSIEGMFHFKN